jgi:RecA/RadA recombinase
MVTATKKAPAAKTSSKTGTVKTRVSTKAVVEKAEHEAQSKINAMYGEILGQVEKKYKLSGGAQMHTERFSSGSAVLDLIMAGGYYPGRWYTMMGKEQSGKSTALMSTMEAALWSTAPLRLYFDYEGSLDFQYFSQMTRKKVSQAQLFGEKDDNGKRVKRGFIEYYSEDVAETFFSSVGALLRRMPDKVYIPEHKGWFLRFDNNKDNAHFKSESFSKLSNATDLFVPIANGSPQALIFLDSYPAMLPDLLDDDDQKSGMAAQARMFSENLRKVRPKMRRKHVNIIGVNQIREKPATMFGSPEYEPCGEALKFVSDCRVRFNAVGIPKHCYGTGPIAEENSVLEDGIDQYRYVKLNTKKNKMGPNFMEGHMRIWMSDPNGQGHGIDQVFDTWQYLKMTGHVTGGMNKFDLTVPGTDKTVKMAWSNLKELVLLKGDALKDAHKTLKLKQPLNLRSAIAAHLKSGNATKSYFSTMSGAEAE